MRRALTVENLLEKKFRMMDFTGEWQDSLGTPEASGCWIIWGHSGNGKTRFTLQLAKYLTNFGLVAYNSLEEGARRSFQKAISEVDMKEVGKRFLILDRESIKDLKVRLHKRKSPDIIIIDSFQHAELTKRSYVKLRDEFQDKLFVFVSHAEGNHPEGRSAKFVRYDADIKIRVEGYVAKVVSRFGGNQDYVIWEEGAKEYWQ